MNISNEVLNLYFGQGAAKISHVKVGGKKMSADSAGSGRSGLELGKSADIFF